MNLIELLRSAEDKCWITGREPADDTICIRITEEDRKQLLRKLVPWWRRSLAR